jgi:hypothetical protein
MKCKHRFTGTWRRSVFGDVFRETCTDCGHWLSLGPSNDEPLEVQIEIRAAELTAPRARTFVSDDVWSGWVAHERGWCPAPTIAALAGYLARVIATHPDGAE